MDSLDFVFTEETSTKTLDADWPGGYLAGIIISGINLHSGTPTLAVKALYKGIHDDATPTEGEGTAVDLYSKASPAVGTFSPFTRMQTTAGADNSGAGEFTRFFIPSGSIIEVSSSANLTADVTVVIDKV